MAEESIPKTDVATSNVEPTQQPSYEFTPEQNRIITDVASGFNLIGIVLAIQVVKLTFRVISGIWYLTTGGGRVSTWELTFERAALVAFLAPLAYWMFRSSSSLEAVANTTGRDIDHLMTGFRAIRASYNYILAIVIIALGIGLLLLVLSFLGITR